MKGTRRGWWHYASGYDAHDPGARWEAAAAAAAAGGFEMDGGSAIVLNVPMGAKRATKSTLAAPKQVVNGRQNRGKRIEGRSASQKGHERPRATGRRWCGRGVVGGGWWAEERGG